jgi:hypothetical protein
VGTWEADRGPARTIENTPNGRFVATFARNRTNAVTIEGMWQVKDGFIVGTMTKASLPNAGPAVESNKVISIDDNKLVVLSKFGGTNLLTYHKRP